MKAMITGRLMAIKDSEDRDGMPQKTAIILQDGEIYPTQILNVKAICSDVKEGEEYTLPVNIIPYINKRTGKASLLALLDSEYCPL